MRSASTCVCATVGLMGWALLANGAAKAEPVFQLGETLPHMAMKFCWTLAAAEAQASLSRDISSLAVYNDEMDKAVEGCEISVATITPLRREGQILPFVGWVPVYSDAGRHLAATVLKDGTFVPFTVEKRTLSYYLSTIYTAKGPFFIWAELPDEPYVLKYLREREKERRQ